MPLPPHPEAPPHSEHIEGSLAKRYATGWRPFADPPLADGPVEPTLVPNYEQEQVEQLGAIRDELQRFGRLLQGGLTIPEIELPTPIVNVPAQTVQRTDMGPVLGALEVLSRQFMELGKIIEQRVGQENKPSVVYGGAARTVQLLDDTGNIKINPATDPKGTFNYDFGTAGIVTPLLGAKVRGIFAHATTAGTINIFGKGAIPIPANTVFFDTPELLIGDGVSTIVLSGTDSYYIRYL